MHQKHRTTYRKSIAAFFLTLLTVQLLAPAAAWALTSGPAQPEVASFKQAGVSDMVDLFSGNFNYNLPVLDVDGYPVNLSYQSGSGIDEEAGWVGLGWNLNVGAINRQLRGIPDDMSGDEFKTEHYTKPKVTVGGRMNAKFEFKGKGFNGNATLTLGVFSDNYTGIGAELGANAGTSFSLTNSGSLTAGMGLSLLSSTASGVDVTPSLSLAYHQKINENTTVSPGVSATLGYNTRGGLKSLTLGTTFSIKNLETGASNQYDVVGSVISYNTDPVQPRIQVPYRSTYGSLSVDIGVAGWGAFAGGGPNGYKSVREVLSRKLSNPAFGFLYAERGKQRKDAMMDFLREKESMVIPELPNLAVPIATPDLFSYTSQGTSGQFRLYRGGTGVLGDNEAADVADNTSIGFDVGIGGLAHGGVTINDQRFKNTTRRWTKDNLFYKRADFQEPSANPDAEHVFFKQVGEKNVENEDLFNKLAQTAPVAVSISGNQARSAWRKAGINQPGIDIQSDITRLSREVKRTTISYLTAKEASLAGLDKKIKWYAPISYGAAFQPAACHELLNPLTIDRYNTGQYPVVSGDDNTYRKAHHISEITVTDDAGKRNVYGIPVYNASQAEYSFAIGNPARYGSTADVVNNLVNVPMQNNQVKQDDTRNSDHYFHKEEQPGYATSFLLTSILSPDYVDVTGNGISDDDLGTAIKFNYSRIDGLFGWRSPYGTGAGNWNRATINRGLLADPDDDKASFVYGQKELWYMHSIETKTKIAYFITEDRQDALGVLNWTGIPDNTKKQKVLREIRLYSKADLTRPIKIVKLEYGYDLCPQVPNFDGNHATKGKLTLRKVYFQYGNTTKGMAHPYIFHYNNEGDLTYKYGYLLTDRWGTYKSHTDNATNGIALKNDEFPYTIQNGTTANATAGIWQLSEIELPTGGKINVTYESDDYAYVQNKEAMVMVKPDMLIAANGAPVTELKAARGIQLTLPEGMPPGSGDALAWFKQHYLNGSDYLYTKFFVHMGALDGGVNNENLYDFIPCYAKVTGVQITGTTAKVIFETISGGGITMNPVQHAAYQRLRMEYPRYAYPGYKNRISDEGVAKAIQAAVTAIANAAATLDELRRSFNERALKKGFANNVMLNKSFVRLAAIGGVKYGGGARVKKIAISDQWAAMSQGTGAITASYGQYYEYRTERNGVFISSGVASYEPQVGGDENPLRQPVPYVQNIRGAINNFFNLEEPFGESLFPAPSVGYSKVTVYDLDENGNKDANKKTGYVVNEFYTAKEFPVIVKTLPIQMNQHGPKGWYSLLGANSIHELTFSQGYAVELNDMHGKPKATRVFNQGGSEIASTVYHYNTEPLNAGELKLKNSVTVVTENGEVKNNQVIGRQLEVFTDMREQEGSTFGQNIKIGGDFFVIFLVPVFLPHWPYSDNNEYKLFRSACTLKVIQYYGIIDKVVKTDNGSSITTENVAYDGLTGEALITKTQNEFEEPVYSVNLPAYWMYKGMGAAYKNIGTVISSISTAADGEITTAGFNNFLFPGDELVNLNNGNQYWIIESAVNNVTKKRLVDRSGKVAVIAGQPVKIIRSGYRNLLTPPATSMVCLRNPIVSGSNGSRVALADNAERSLWKVLTASAIRLSEEWGGKPACPCPPGTTVSADGQRCLTAPVENTASCFNICAGDYPVIYYGQSGANLLEYWGGSFATLKSDFWGGACSTPCPIGREMPALASAKTDSSAMGTAIEPLAVPPVCARSSAGPNVPCGGVCGRLSRAGIWLCTGKSSTDRLPLNEWVGFETCITAPESKTYYLGFAADNKIRVYIDNGLVAELTANSSADYQLWYVRPQFIAQGQHTLRAEFLNTGGEAAAGLEIYNTSYQQLISPSLNESNANILFSTASLINTNVQTFRDINSQRAYRYSCPLNTTLDQCNGTAMCATPVDRVVNPYVKGYRGNWRAKETKVYQVNRKYKDLFDANRRGVEVKNAGYLEKFTPFWTTSNGTWSTSSLPEWVTANTVTLYDKYGQELENMDALGRYSAANFVFRGDLPGAVASNARNREIYYESFEDGSFRAFCPGKDADSCGSPVFMLNGWAASTAAGPGDVHSGNYALPLFNTITLTTRVHSNETDPAAYLAINSNGEYATKAGTGIYPIGFEPMPAKKYVISAWVKDGQPATNAPGIGVSVSGATVVEPFTRKAVVEKWKLVEALIEIPAVSTGNLVISITPSGGNVKIDDLRMHPFDAHMKSYAYDDRTLRLMAEMDENNFATFYEYDDEGSLIRVKKETDRGIMTIKENRSSYRRRTN